MNTLLPNKMIHLNSERSTKQTQSSTLPHNSAWPLRARWAFASLVLVVVAACGGGGGGGSSSTSGASQSPTTGGTTTAGTTTTATSTTTTTTTAVVVTDANANAQAFASMASKPVNVAVWSQLNSAGADLARSMVPAPQTVIISTFKTILDPTGGVGTVKVFDAVVATGTLSSSRVFQLSSGTLPSGTTPIWVNVNGEDFTKNNPSSESALETRVADLGSALPIPLP
jgi:hypothetical protein